MLYHAKLSGVCSRKLSRICNAKGVKRQFAKHSLCCWVIGNVFVTSFVALPKFAENFKFSYSLRYLPQCESSIMLTN